MVGAGSCSDFHARQIHFFGWTKCFLGAPRFQIQLDCLNEILLRGCEGFALGRYWQIETPGDEPFPVILKYRVDCFHTYVNVHATLDSDKEVRAKDVTDWVTNCTSQVGISGR